MKIIVAAGTGFIGKALVNRLHHEEHSVIVLTRNPAKIEPHTKNVITEIWDSATLSDWARHFDGADAIVNLTGELIAGKRWSKQQKEIILKSRVQSTNILVEAIRQTSRKPSVLINISGVGFYGNVPSGDVPETFPNGNDFLAHVCNEWEKAALKAHALGVRVVIPRLGVVIGKNGGALPRLMLPFKLFSGGYLGSGKQWFPWIHLDDVVKAIVFAIKNPSLSGPVNVVAPEAVTLKTFCEVLGKIMHRPSWTFVPSFVLRLALGEMADMLLTGQRAIPKKLLNAGFTFRYPTLEHALNSIYNK